MSSEGTLVLLGADGTKVGAVEVSGVDVKFPDPSIRWTWVLDARHEPYTGLPIAAVLERARGVRKRYVLVSAEQTAR